MRLILERGGIEGADREARWIIEAVTGRGAGAAALDSNNVDDQETVAVALAQRRVAGAPLQYLTGVAGFRHLELEVGPGVMIPRPETEIVAEWGMAKLPQGGVVVDCGTGSGAIALSIAHERPDARVLATELSESAFSWAGKNVAALGLEVELIACDLLNGLNPDLRGHLDVVVSNPPYVALSEREMLPTDVVDHEPHEALLAGEDGLDVIRRLSSEVTKWLRPGGWLVIEMGENHASAVRGLLGGDGYVEIATHKDLTGRPRIAVGRRPL